MLRCFVALLAGALCLSLVGGQATARDDKKSEEKTLKGTACCAKCELKEATKCQTVLLVKEDGKEVKYYFDQDSEKKFHSDYCKGKTEVTVKGKVTEKDGKKWVAVSSVEKKKT